MPTIFAEAIGRLAKRLRPARTRNDDDLSAGCPALLPDRGTFLRHANTALEASRRSSPALLLIGIDEFVSVCATAGQGDGNQVQRRVARAISQAVDVTTRGRGIVGQTGPDEFAVLVDCMLSDEVRHLAELIGVEARQSTASLDPIGNGATVSIGIAFCLPATTAAAALDVAISALDRARRDGGNRCRSIAQGGTRHIDLMQDPRGLTRVPPNVS